MGPLVPLAVVLAPTRELVLQTTQQGQAFGGPLGVRTVAGPAGMKAVIAPPLSRSVGNLSATAEALLPDLHRKLTPLIPNDPNDAGVEAVRRRYPGRRPCIGDLVRLLPGRRIRIPTLARQFLGHRHLGASLLMSLTPVMAPIRAGVRRRRA